MTPRTACLAAAVASLLAVPAPARSQSIALPEFIQHFGIESWWDVVQFRPWTASLGLSFTDHEQRLEGVGGATNRSSGQLFTESFTISNDGFAVVDPRLFVGSVSLGLLLTQDRQEAQGRETTQSGELVSYGFNGQVFPESPYTGNFDAVRSQTASILPSGTRTKSDYQGAAVAFHLREGSFLRELEWLPYFTANLRFAQQRQRQTTTTEAQSFEQDDRRSLATLDFHNGGERSDLGFQYQYLELENQVYREGSYTSHSVTASHSIDFGPTFNRRLDSHLNWYERTGAQADADFTSLEVNESLTIDHNVSRSSNYFYLLNRQDTFYGPFATHSAGAQIFEQLYNNLSLSGAATGTYSDLPEGTLTTAGVSGNFSYTRALPWQGTLGLNGGAGYYRRQNEVPAGVVPVVDSPYSVPQETGAGSAILLKDRNIVVASLIVVVVKGGTRVTAQVGVDYTVRVDGDRTSIVPEPASALMRPGDPLAVSYAYLIAGDARFENRSRSAFISLDWSWIGMTAGRDESDERPLDGGSAERLLDERRDYGSVYVYGSWDAFQAKATVSATRNDSTRLAYTERRFDQYLAYTPTPDLQVSLSANQYRTDYELPQHTVTGGSARIDLSWSRGGWITNGYIGRRVYRDTDQPDETVDETGVRVRRTWTLLELNVALGAQRRLRGEVSSSNAFFHIGAIRRF
jgi:hypothetical protein